MAQKQPTYKVLGQVVTEAITYTPTTKSASANFVTINTASAHYIVVGQPVTVSETGLSASVTTKSLSASVATLFTSDNHRITAGQSITVENVDATFNGTYIVTSASANVVQYRKNAANVTSTSASGTISYLDRAFNGTYTVVADPTPTSFIYYAPAVNLTTTSASATTITDVPWKVAYTCASGKAMVSSTIIVCNHGITNAQYQIAVSNDTSPSKQHLIVYNDIVEPNETITYTIGLTLDDTVKYLLFGADNADVSFNVFGMEYA